MELFFYRRAEEVPSRLRTHGKKAEWHAMLATTVVRKSREHTVCSQRRLLCDRSTARCIHWNTNKRQGRKSCGRFGNVFPQPVHSGAGNLLCPVHPRLFLHSADVLRQTLIFHMRSRRVGLLMSTAVWLLLLWLSAAFGTIFGFFMCAALRVKSQSESP